MKRNLNLIVALVFFALCASCVQAATLYWDRNGTVPGASVTPNGNWSTTSGQFTTTSSGSGGTAAFIISWSTLGSADTAYFAAGSDATAAYNVSVLGTVSVGGITFGYGGPATLVNNGGTISADAAAVSIVNTVNSTINVVIAGTGALTKSGAGTLTLGTQASTFSGNLTIANGGVTISTINDASANGPLGNSANAVTLGGSGTTGQLTITGAGLSSSKPFTMATSGTGIINPQANNLTLTGVFSGSGNFTKNGSGTLFLGTANSSGLTGNTSISAGTVRAVTSGSFAGSTVSIGGSGTLTVEYSTADTGWTNGALTYSAGTSVHTIDFMGNTPSATVAPVQVVNALTFTAIPTFNIASTGGSLADGTYRLIKYGSTSGGSFPIAVNSMPGSQVGTISNNAGQLTLWLIAVTPSGAKHWATGDGTWEIGGSTPWSGATSYADGDVVQFLDFEATGSPTVTLNTTVAPTSVLVSNTVAHYTITGSGDISGAIALTKKDPGTLTLDVANTYTGGTVLSGGTINIKNSAALGGSASQFTINSGAFDNTSGSPLTTTSYLQNWAGDFTFVGTSDLNLGSGTVTIVGATRTATVSASKLSVNGIVTGAAGIGLTKGGAGTLSLGGANTYNGDTRIGAGTLVLANSSALQNSVVDLTGVDSGTLAFATGLGTATFPNIKSSTPTPVRTLSLQDESGGAVALTVGGDNGSQTCSANIDGAGSLTVAGTGTLGTYTGLWTFAGDTTVNAGATLQVGVANNILPFGSGKGNVVINGKLINDRSQVSVNGLSGTGTVTSSSSFDNIGLVVGNNDASSTFNGQIVKSPAKNNSLKKVGTGTLTLVGVSSIGTVDGLRIYNGRVVGKHAQSLGSFKTTVGGEATAATLEMVNTNGVGTGYAWDTTMSLILSNNATLLCSGGGQVTYTKASNPSIAQAASTTVTLSTAAAGDCLTFNSAVSDGSSTALVIVDGVGTNRLASSGNYAGNWQLNNGTLQCDSTQVLGSGSHTLTLNGGVIELRVPAGVTYTATSVIVGGNTTIRPSLVTPAAGSSHTLGSAGTLSIGAFTLNVVAADNITSGTGTVVVAGATTLTGDATFNVANGASASTVLTLTGAVGESGSHSLTKIGSGQLNLNNAANAYTGDTTISNGIVSIDGDGTLGSGAGTLHLSGGTLAASASGNTVPNPIDLTADSSITTSSTAAGPTLNLSSSTIGGSAGTLTFRNNGADAATDTFLPRFSGSGFTFTRPIVIDNGSLGLTELNSYNTTGTDQQFDGEISGSGSYKRNASSVGTGGRTIFTVANTYAGGTTVSRGTLVVNNTTGSGTGTGAVIVGSDGKLMGTGSISGAVTNSGIVAPGSSIGELDTGTESWNSGGTYEWEVSNVAGTPGVEWDHLNITGDIDVPATSATYTVKVQPSGGTITGFDKDVSTAWVIATASGSVNNLAASDFTVNDTADTDDLAGGQFVVGQSGSTVTLTFTNNHAPVAQFTNYTRAKYTTLKIPITDLLASRTSDQDGQGRTLVQIGTNTVNQSANGYTLTTNASYIFYTNMVDNTIDEIGYVVVDQANYRAGDTKRYATNTLRITTSDSIGTVTITNAPGGSMTISFFGIPDYSYVIQRSSDVTFPPTPDEILTTNAPAGGLFEYTETPPYNPAFYRIRSN